MVNKAMIRHFPKGTRLHQIINKNKVQVAYSSTPNMERIIKGHNNKIIREHLGESQTTTPDCNCRGGKKNCPVDGLCQQEGVTYMATVTTPDETRAKEYRGSTATKFKARHANHKTAMKNKNCPQKTTLSSYFWKKSSQGFSPAVKFEILKKARPYSVESGKCNLCIEEKLAIALADRSVSLNKRQEVVAKCRHRANHVLQGVG
jgi:hypothetical protein